MNWEETKTWTAASKDGNSFAVIFPFSEGGGYVWYVINDEPIVIDSGTDDLLDDAMANAKEALQ